MENYLELRSFNVEKIWKESVKCVIGEDLGVDKKKFEENTPAIKSLISQIKTYDGQAHLCKCHIRHDDEIWTPYLQIVEMLIRMGARTGLIKYEGTLKIDTVITFLV